MVHVLHVLVAKGCAAGAPLLLRMVPPLLFIAQRLCVGRLRDDRADIVGQLRLLDGLRS